jgi:protein O-mannosyl-transferase
MMKLNNEERIFLLSPAASAATPSVVTGHGHSAPAVQPATAPSIRDRQKLILCLALFAVTLVFYNPIAHDGFVLLDDVPYILNNPPVLAGLTWNTVKWSFTTFHAGYWHPLTWLSHALDCQLFGLNPAGHHYVSLLFHAASAVLLFLLLQEATTLVWPSLLVAALFALHPVNVESVAWAAERKNVLSMFFFLLAMLVYGRYARRGGIGRYSTVVVLFILGLMAKPQIITLPCVLLLWDYWPLQRMFAKSAERGVEKTVPGRSLTYLLVEKIPLFLLVVAASILTVKAQAFASAVRTLGEFSLRARVENAVVSYARYLGILFWPRHLAPLYPHPGNSLPAWQVLVSAVVLLALTAICFRWRDRRYLAMGWLWFLGVLVPMIGLVQVGDQAMADRFVYIPMIGILISVVWAGWDFTEEKNISKQWIAVPAAVAVVTLGALTYHQLGYWKDGETLWRYTLSVTDKDKNYMAHDNLAMVLDKQGRAEEAIPEFKMAEALHPYPLPQVLSMGIYEQRHGHPADAKEMYQEVLNKSADPKMLATAWTQMGSANVQLKNYDQAKQSYETALKLNPDDGGALVGSGLLAERSGDAQFAAEALTRSVRVEPSDISYLLLADALRGAQRAEEARGAESIARNTSKDFDRAVKGANEMEIFFGCFPSKSVIPNVAVSQAK